MTTSVSGSAVITVQLAEHAPTGWNDYLSRFDYDGFHLRSEWGNVFRSALRHQTFYVWASEGGRIVGVLPLAFVSGPIFGRFLCSQPYLNTGGVLADTPDIAGQLIDRAVRLADELNVRHLELRHEHPVHHDRLNATVTEKVHMRLPLPSTSNELWEGLKSKVRSQIKKPRNDQALTVAFGRQDQLQTFYDIFCRNMRDLGTPPFPKSLFGGMLNEFGDAAEICTVSFEGRPVASGFLLHGPGTTLIPSASALREYNRTSCNMLMYWHVLERSVERGQACFDFGRSSVDAGTYKFKQQWGCIEQPAVWQYCSRHGSISDARPNSGKFDLMIAAWQKLPVWFTKLIGPTIVRGIP
ncbi:MAG: FemAB family PEP-CTERM system-associated protein [Planctomycetaceae bacterium]